MLKDFLKTDGKKPSAAIFLSGSGTNAEQLLKRRTASSAWVPALLVTDRPQSSAAKRLAEKYGIDLLEHDIAAFYKAHGMDRVSIRTPEALEIREQWTGELRRKLAPYSVDFGILAGFVPLTNIVEDFPCLNIHPGDLTVEEKGVRLLAGLHTIPIETAILMGKNTLRSSVIVVQPYTFGASEMDSGPILGISDAVGIDFDGTSPEELRLVQKERKGKSREEIRNDRLSRIAGINLEKLKQEGDWILFPQVVEDFAAGRFALDEKDRLLRRAESGEIPIKTVVYSIHKPPEILPL